MREKTYKLIAFSADVSKRVHSEWFDLSDGGVYVVKNIPSERVHR